VPKLRVHNFSVSIDGYAAGPDQSLDNPLGVGGMLLHNWAIGTRTFRKIFGEEGGDEGVDDRFAAAGEVGLGATIMGRNMFGPIRGDWTDDEWKGWWGDDPPYHHPTFVLTHHPRESITMEGGTVFHFVTDGIEAALGRAYQAANGQDVRLAGGVLCNPAVSAGRAGRRDAPGVCAAVVRQWRTALGQPRPGAKRV
jgi:dihydrofolate reductase